MLSINIALIFLFISGTPHYKICFRPLDMFGPILFVPYDSGQG